MSLQVFYLSVCVLASVLHECLFVCKSFTCVCVSLQVSYLGVCRVFSGVLLGCVCVFATMLLERVFLYKCVT